MIDIKTTNASQPFYEKDKKLLLFNTNHKFVGYQDCQSPEDFSKNSYFGFILNKFLKAGVIRYIIDCNNNSHSFQF